MTKDNYDAQFLHLEEEIKKRQEEIKDLRNREKELDRDYASQLFDEFSGDTVIIGGKEHVVTKVKMDWYYDMRQPFLYVRPVNGTHLGEEKMILASDIDRYEKKG